jgi:hypothetical protein
MFETYGISTIAGVSGPADVALTRLARGELDGGNNTCHH